MSEAEKVSESEKTLDHITGEVVDSAYRLHTGLGPGLLESVYENILARDLERRGLRVARQQLVSFNYDGLHRRNCLRVNLVVESRVVVEIKSVEKILPVHPKQLLTYLRLMHLPVGLLINFAAPTLKEGLRRFVNKLKPSASPPAETASRKSEFGSRTELAFRFQISDFRSACGRSPPRLRVSACQF